MALSGVLLMLSVLAHSKVNYQLPGTCPTPPTSTLFTDLDGYRSMRTNLYHTAMRYESDIKGSQNNNVLGSFKDDLNCLQATFTNQSSDWFVSLQDCGYYEGIFHAPDLVNTTAYNITLRNVDRLSKCVNRTTDITNMSIWMDEERRFIIFWSCLNNYQKTSHKQVVVIFISTDILWDSDSRLDKTLVTQVVKFAEDTLWFTKLNITDFDLNQRLLEEGDSNCPSYNCTASCVGPNTGESGVSPVVFIIGICFLVVLVFMIVI